MTPASAAPPRPVATTPPVAAFEVTRTELVDRAGPVAHVTDVLIAGTTDRTVHVGFCRASGEAGIASAPPDGGPWTSRVVVGRLDRGRPAGRDARLTPSEPGAPSYHREMHVGLSVIFQNPGRARPDHEVYADDLRLARLAEPLGFESIWSVEHHFTDYTMCPDVMQFLTYMAGCTERIRLGSMVCVLPWHDPLRVAEQVAMLDTLSGGRAILGIGRGTGRVEFDGFRVEMPEARARFAESADMILTGLERGWVEYDGQYVRQPRVDLRPAPSRSFRGRTYAAAISPESAAIMARMGVGLLVIPQKPWQVHRRELADYRAVYREAIGEDPPPPYCAGWTFVDESADRAEELARRYIGAYWDSVVRHYEFDRDYLKHTPGYEFHGQMYDRLTEPGGAERMAEFFLGIQVWGTPDQVIDKIVTIQDHTYCDGYMAVCSYAGMPVDEAERNLRLFASDVMPALQAMAPAYERLGVPA